jgi:hypothetical protein
VEDHNSLERFLDIVYLREDEAICWSRTLCRARARLCLCVGTSVWCVCRWVGVCRWADVALRVTGSNEQRGEIVWLLAELEVLLVAQM